MQLPGSPPLLPATPELATPPDGVTLHSPTDPSAVREKLFANVLTAASAMQPVENQRHTLSLSGVHYKGPSTFGKKDYKRAILSGTTLARPMYGTLTLTDKVTQKPVSTKNVRLADVPYLTDHGTYIYRGVEYGMGNQLRLRPGAFARVKDNGEFESHLAAMPGRGMTHRVYMDPATSVFKIRAQQAEFPLLPVLDAMGVDEKSLREAWGDQIYADNRKKASPKVLEKAWEKLTRRGVATDHEGKKAELLESLRNTMLDPEVTQRTLGKPHANLSAEVYLDVTKKLLGLSRGEAEPDDRDAMPYQLVMGPEDLFAERLKRARNAMRGALFKHTYKGSLDRVQPGLFDHDIIGALLNSGLGSTLEEINPLELLDQQTRITRLGEGGLPDADSVPLESRAVQPSQVGFIDFIRTSESEKVGVDMRLAAAARKGDNNRLYTPVRDLQSGKLVYRSAQELAEHGLASMQDYRNGLRDGVVNGIKDGRPQPLDPGDVRYLLPDFEKTFSPLGNLVPFKSADKGQRAVMAARMITQSLGLVKPEAPLLQMQDPDSGRGYADIYGERVGATRSPAAGSVVSVTPDEIVIRGDDGETRKLDLYNNYVYNRKSIIHQTPTVEPGARVTQGQLLARSNFTDDKGQAAYGLNLRTAYLPYQGHNFEDAWVISEEAAEKLTSEHAYQHGHQWTPDYRRGLKTYLSMFPAKYDKETLKNFDDNGVAKVGTKLREGEPLLLAARRKEADQSTVGDRPGATLHGGRGSGWRDASIVWEHKDPGEVVDVFDDGKFTNVVVKMTSKMQVGDKLCFDEETEILTRDGWKSVAAVGMADEICTLQAGDRIEYLRPTALHMYRAGGRMYRIKSQQVDQFVTAAHRMYVRRRNAHQFELIPAETIYGKRVQYKKNGTWVGQSPPHVIIPGPAVRAGQSGRGTRKLADVQLSTRTFMTLLGAFVSEGSTFNDPKCGNYGLHIAQIKEPNRAQLFAELASLGVKCVPTPSGAVIYSKALLNYFSSLGHTAGNKRLPNGIFDWAIGDLKILFAWLMWGDGHAREDGRPVCYTTTSPGLAGDIQRLCLHIGYAANVICDLPATVQTIKGKEYNCLPRYSVRVVTTKLTPAVNHSHTKKQKVQEEYIVPNYDQPVYCVTVPGHVLYVRRNGKTCWSGNSGLHGDKGVVAKIIPSSEMPTDAQGRPFEVLANPYGLISRTNAAQAIESALQKVAAKTGKPYHLKDFDDINDLRQFAADELKKNGMTFKEDLLDPTTGRKIPKVQAGVRYYMKLHHQAEGKESGRGTGAYSAEGVPAKGGFGGSKRIGMLELSALLSHGAVDTIRDATLIRGQASPDYHAQFAAGFDPPTPKVPWVHKKFLNQLRAAGIDPVRRGGRVQLMAVTDDVIQQMAGDRNLTNADTVNWDADMSPIPGGLFDKKLTGSHGGQTWSAIALHEPMPNPVFEEPIRRVLGLTEKQFRSVLRGDESIHGQSGPQGIAKALGSIDLDKEIKAARDAVASGKVTKRDEGVRRLKFLLGAKRQGITPKDWVLTRAPVLPPAYRAVSLMGDKKMPLVADANYLYRELWDADQNLREASKTFENVGDERETVYDAFKAVTGLGEPVTVKNQQRKVQGVLRHMLGDSPKQSVVHRQLLGSQVDMVGRAVATPNPDLNMDQIGLPEEAAWGMYGTRIVRRLVRGGRSRVDALQAVENRDEAARQALLDEMDAGPVIYNRAPTLHRYGFMAAMPQLVQGHTIQVSPIIVKPPGLDFDGDALQFHLPGPDAQREAAKKMLPSKNLVAVANFKTPLYQPSQEYTGGLYEASTAKDDERPPAVYITIADALAAVKRGELDPGRRVEILKPEDGDKGKDD